MRNFFDHNRMSIASFVLVVLGLGAAYFGISKSSNTITIARTPENGGVKVGAYCNGDGYRLERLIVLDSLLNGKDGITAGKVSRLGELIILEGLFGRDSNKTSGGSSRLERLIVLDSIFNGSERAETGADTAKPGLESRHISRLGELLVLDGFFGSLPNSNQSSCSQPLGW